MIGLHEHPEIHSTWGQIRITCNGRYFSHKDAVIIDSYAQPWDWDWQGPGFEGMHHSPGYRSIDLDHFFFDQFQDQYRYLILSTGRENKLTVNDSVIQYAKSKGILEVYILQTGKALELFKELQKNAFVCIFVHTTC
ncbi:hypothetical protein FGO68_gene16378 [Halteria grandinella]|uniref:Uncharacterized protein n=1 Tax=Halteria grandinella TaxID=5974 RepID=A0A8J8NLZ3_HALGN|nr:hypothetical protein FGO68_gene16378 [Halteria grandinella]